MRNTPKNKKNHEKQGETLRNYNVLGGRQVFSIFCVCAHQPKFAQKSKEKTITCDILQNTSD